MSTAEVEFVDAAIESGDLEIVRQTLAGRPDLMQAYAGRWLGLAVYLRNVDAVKTLIELGCNVNAERQLGAVTLIPLDTAISTENPEMVRLLLSHGANARHNRLVISAVIAEKHSLEFVQLLEQAGADLHQVFVNEYTDQWMNALSTAIDWQRKDVEKYLRSQGCTLPEQTPVANATTGTVSDDVIAFCTDVFGQVEPLALIEIVPTDPPIAVHVVLPDSTRNHVTLFTTGMSNLEFEPPPGESDFQWAELFIQLPANWPLGKQELSDPAAGWPIHLLRILAKNCHSGGRWLGPACVVTLEEPPAPFAPSVGFTAVLLLAEKSFSSSDHRQVHLYRLVPIYEEERQLEMRHGTGALARALDDANCPFVVDVHRKNAAI